MHILIAEDDQLSQLVAHDLLKIIVPNAEVTVVGNGQEAFTLLQEKKFDLILSDVDMPVMDGKELVQRLKSQPDWQTPIIAVTAFAIIGDRERLLMHGFDAYLAKPINLDQMQDVLAKFIETEVPQ